LTFALAAAYAIGLANLFSSFKAVHGGKPTKRTYKRVRPNQQQPNQPPNPPNPPNPNPNPNPTNPGPTYQRKRPPPEEFLSDQPDSKYLKVLVPEHSFTFENNPNLNPNEPEVDFFLEHPLIPNTHLNQRPNP